MMYGAHGYFPGAYAGGFPWMSILGGLFMLALIVLVVFATIRLAKGPRPPKGRHGHAEAHDFPGDSPVGDARAILAERFARGEIDAEAYRSMKDELGIKE